ncbi:MAG: S-layer homology domain-containing protein [Clostridia bacterium]|nr:S-layer homology domain-containing protein [Clostridia bacterium]
MKKLFKSKLYCKILSAVLALSLAMAPVVSAEVAIQTVVTETDVTLTVACGEEFAGKDVVVQVIDPSGSLENLKTEDGKYGITNSDAVNSNIVCLYHGVADASGNVEFTFKPNSDKGKYTVRVNASGLYKTVETTFKFITDNDSENIVTALAENITADTVAAIFEKPANENVYKPYQILGLDENKMYESFDKADAATKTKIFECISKELNASAVKNTAAFTKIFEDAVLVECLNAATDAGAYLEANAAALKFTEQKAYKEIYADADVLDDDVKAEFYKAVAKADLSGKSVDAAADELGDILLLTTLSYTKAVGVLDTVITKFEDELKDAGVDFEAYSDADKPLEICRDVIDAQPFESLEDFAEELNAVIPDGNGGSSGGSGGSGGGSSSSGSKVSYSFSDVAPVIPDVPNASSYVFNDIATVVWAHEAITVLHEKGIISGRPDGSFAPDAAVTREEFVKMLVAALGFETSGAAADFADVSGNEWFAPYVYTAYNNGIVSGMGDGFGVGRNISRQDMAVMCANALKVKGAELKAVKAESNFADNISDYAKEAVEKLYSAGLINGLSDTEFGATGTTTRAQAAKLLYEVTKVIS